jgi:prepilin-type N-terminal cleavage/methylation domain-containing protein/prepilin-type processing-associated H-X9-DG protein
MPHSAATSPKRQGFTLIELLVVIAIIAILAAILFPVFAKVREKARQTMCLSNEKQIGLGFAQYVEDYDETYPYSWNKATNADWTLDIQPYIKNGSNSSNWSTNGGVFACPSNPQSTSIGQYVVRQDVCPQWYGATGNNISGPLVTLAQIDAPASKIFVDETGANNVPNGTYYFNFTYSFPTGESRWQAYEGAGAEIYALDSAKGWGDCDYNNKAAIDWGGEWASGCTWAPRYRHNNTTNFLYMDGHVKTIARGQLDYATSVFMSNICTDKFWNGNTCQATVY